MIINHAHRFIFLHIPKTAGTAITSWLSRFTEWNDIELGGTAYGEAMQEVYGKRFRLHKHSPSWQVRKVIGHEVWNAYYKFAVVRNPFDRLVSAYEFYRCWDHPGVASVKAMPSFDEFLGSDYFARDRLNPSRATGSQAGFLGLGQGFEIDRVCRFEHLAQDLSAVAEELGLPAPDLTVSNESQRAPLETYYTDERQRLVADLYAEDFDAFGYAKRLPVHD